MKKLRDYAKEHDVTYRTAYNHFHRGLITNAYQLPTGTIVIPDNAQQELKKEKCEYIVTYARVSSKENENRLENQSKRVIDFCNAKGWKVAEVIEEVGSGINDNRKKLLKILTDGKATKIVVEHKDRLTRFGFNFIKTICDKSNCEIIVINNVENPKEDIIQDFVSIITSFCAKIYGQRRSRRKTEFLIKNLENQK